MRRTLAALALGLAAAVSGCGGSVGVGGTGSYSYAPIEGFGSIYVGGIEYDDSQAAVFDEDGAAIARDSLRLGMVVDISHVSDPLFWDVIRYVKKPVLASHSSARALANVPRNMTDAMLKAVARNGGAV